ncbi:MAG: polysaccharide deacetylase family protein [Solirubrobacteraceae bacterium]
MIRHGLAPVQRDAAAALGLQRTMRAPGVALTFDDGPHPEGTPAVLEVLAAAGAVATFFVVGEQVARRPQLVAEIIGGGHEVALHGYEHRLQLRFGAREVAEDLERGVTAVREATGGAPPVWHRPPYGIYSAAGLEWVRAAGMRPLLWSRWGKDWRALTTPDRIARRALRNVIAGDVILLHDADFYSASGSHRRTVAALAPMLAELNARKLDTVLPV